MTDAPRRITDLPLLPPRTPDAHKGDFGTVLVVGGSRGMIGAPALTGNAALRGGAGLVTLAVPECIQLAVATLCPCATSIPLLCDARGTLAPQALRDVIEAAQPCDVLAVGPGMGVGTVQQNIVQALIEQADTPVVLDADGLNNLARIPDWPARRRCPLVLTPHPGEMGSLTGQSARDVQSAREKTVLAAATQWGDPFTEDPPPLVVVLKGSGTLVTDARKLYVNDSGNPAMATGGAGDVLTGLIAALVAQKMNLFDAAVLGAYLHGLAGDLAANDLGQYSVTALDILDALSDAFVAADL